jgi:hypothetical protein
MRPQSNNIIGLTNEILLDFSRGYALLYIYIYVYIYKYICVYKYTVYTVIQYSVCW